MPRIADDNAVADVSENNSGKGKPHKLVNRGPAGLHTSIRPRTTVKTEDGPGDPQWQQVPTQARETIIKNGVNGPALWESAPKDRIAEDLLPLAVDIDSVSLDANNARLHPERNMISIKDSLAAFGQMKPIVVRREGMTIIAGNGTWTAAKELGWSKIAVTVTDLNEVEAVGYGLADNRTAELAKWDFEVVARLDKLLQEANQPNIGWTMDELEVLRAADFTPPAVDENFQFGSGGDDDDDPLLVSFTPDQYESVGKAISLLKQCHPDNESLEQADAIKVICDYFIASIGENPGVVDETGPAATAVDMES